MSGFIPVDHWMKRGSVRAGQARTVPSIFEGIAEFVIREGSQDCPTFLTLILILTSVP